MSESEQKGLRRLDLENQLPASFEGLSDSDRKDMTKRLAEQDLELRKEIGLKVGKSQIAEHDISVGVDAVQRLDHERKVYSKHMKGETGSGTYDLKIKGGDTRFIVPVLIVIGVIILGVIAIVAL